MNPKSCLLPLILASAIVSSQGCKKEAASSDTGAEEAPQAAAAEAAAADAAKLAEVPPPPPIQGAAEFKAALNRGDYVSAVQTLAQIKASLRQDQYLEFSKLSALAREKIGAAAATDPSAAQAMQVLGAVLTGR